MERAAHEDAVTFALSSTGTLVRANPVPYAALLAIVLFCQFAGFSLVGNLIAGFGIEFVTMLACIRLVRPDADITPLSVAFSAVLSLLWLAVTAAISTVSHFLRYAHAWALLIIAGEFVIILFALRITAAPFFYALYPGNMRNPIVRSWEFFKEKPLWRWFWLNALVEAIVVVLALPATLTARLPLVHVTLLFTMQVLQAAFLLCYLAYVVEKRSIPRV